MTSEQEQMLERMLAKVKSALINNKEHTLQALLARAKEKAYSEWCGGMDPNPNAPKNILQMSDLEQIIKELTCPTK